MADIIRLFDKNETNFDHYETVIDNCISCRVVQEWNGMYSLTMTTPIDNRIVEEKILKVPTPKNEQLFRIANVTKVVRKGEYAYNVYARHITYDLLDDLLLDIRPTNATQKVALDAILNQSENTHPFTGYSDVTGKHTANYVRMNPIQAIMGQQDNSLLNLWGGNLERDNFNFRINATSVDRGFTVELGKNLVGITETIDISEVTTRLYPTIVIEEPTVTKLPEKYVDSPLIGNYKSPNIKELRLDLTEEQKELSLTELYKFMRAECQKQYDLGVDKPTVNYEIDFVSLRNTEQYKHLGILEQVDISDTIYVKVDLIGVDLETQVIKYEYDSITEKFIKIQLGNFKPKLTSQTNDIKKLVDKTIRESEASFSLKMKTIADRITGNNGGYQITRLNNLGEPYETLWMDTPNVDTATNVIRINQQGIAGSNNGINGPYNMAITNDGWIVAERIAANELSAITANLGTVTAGRIQDKDNQSYWDLNTKEIKLNVSELKVNSKNVVQEDTYNNEKPVYGSTAPTVKPVGKLWVDTSVTPNLLKRWNGSAWVIINDTSALATRVSQAEQKITPSAITTTVSNALNQDNKPLFAKTSEVKQTVDSWTAKFSQIGGTNLIKNPNYMPFTGYDGSVVALSKVSVPEWGTYEATRVVIDANPNGTSTTRAYYNLDLDETDLDKQHTFSVYVKNNRPPTGSTVIIDSNRFGTQRVAPQETKRVVINEYVREGSVPQFGIMTDTPAWFVDVTVFQPQLEMGSVVSQFSQNKDELITGITWIDKDGAHFGREGETIETGVAYDGLRIRDVNEEIAAFTSSGAVIRDLQAETLSGNVMNTLEEHIILDVGNGKPYPTVQEALWTLRNTKHIRYTGSVTVNVHGTHTENIEVADFSGSGRINLNIIGKVIGSLRTYGNKCAVWINGTNYNEIRYSGRVFQSKADFFVKVNNLTFNGLNNSDSVGAQIMDGSLGLIYDCDIANCKNGIYSGSGAKTTAYNNRGTCSQYGALAYEGGILWVRGQTPKGVTAHVANSGTGFSYPESISPTDSTFSPPTAVKTTYTGTFKPSDIYTYSVKYGARSSHYGRTAAQNRWDRTTDFFKGRIVFGANVYNYLSDRDSTPAPTVQIRLRRSSSTHGTSASVAPTPEWTGAPNFGGATRGNWTPWVTIPYTLIGSSGYTFSFYDGSTGNKYAIWDSAEIKVTKIKTV